MHANTFILLKGTCRGITGFLLHRSILFGFITNWVNFFNDNSCRPMHTFLTVCINRFRSNELLNEDIRFARPSSSFSRNTMSPPTSTGANCMRSEATELDDEPVVPRIELTCRGVTGIFANRYKPISYRTYWEINFSAITVVSPYKLSPVGALQEF